MIATSLKLRHIARTRPPCVAALSIALAAFALAGTTHSLDAQPAGRGFLFDQPTGSISFNLGFSRPNAESEIFDFSREQLTLGKSDFNSISLGIEYARYLTANVDIVGGLGWAGNSKRSEFRDWEEEDGTPIEQTTKFTRLPITAGARLYVLSRGSSVGQFAWVPSKYAPYLGVGAGAIWYSFVQSGDFVDFEDLEILTETLKSSGWAPTAHVTAGLDVNVSPRAALSAEGRYSWASATMSRDFRGFDDIDLSGFLATFGLRLRF